MKTAVLLSHILLLVLAIGCSKEEPPASTAAATPSRPAAAPDGGAVPASSATPAPATPARAPRALATADGRIPGVRAEVTELKRTSGGTVTLRFTLLNESARDINVSDVQELLDMTFVSYPVGGVHLIDPVGKKKYFVARDSENNCVCSMFSALRKGERANHWAKFPAPPDDVQQISVLLPTFSPMDDVPIGR